MCNMRRKRQLYKRATLVYANNCAERKDWHKSIVLPIEQTIFWAFSLVMQ